MPPLSRSAGQFSFPRARDFDDSKLPTCSTKKEEKKGNNFFFIKEMQFLEKKFQLDFFRDVRLVRAARCLRYAPCSWPCSAPERVLGRLALRGQATQGGHDGDGLAGARGPRHGEPSRVGLRGPQVATPSGAKCKHGFSQGRHREPAPAATRHANCGLPDPGCPLPRPFRQVSHTATRWGKRT